MRTLAVANQKGGSGKTVTAVNVAAWWARQGEPTLLVDLDAQASASLHLDLSRSELAPSVADVLYDSESHRITDSIRRVRAPGSGHARPGGAAPLDLLPGHGRLRDADTELTSKDALRAALRAVEDRYARVVVDCPPSLSKLTLTAFEAADLVLVPTPADFLNVRGLGQIRSTLEAVGVPWRVVLTKLDRRTRLADEIGQQVRSAVGERALESEVRVNIRIAEAPAEGATIFEYAPSSRGAEDYAQLAQEIREVLDGLR